MPLFLFSGTFFPISQLPAALEAVARVTPLWHGVELARDCTLGHLAAGDLGHAAYLLVWVGGRAPARGATACAGGWRSEMSCCRRRTGPCSRRDGSRSSSATSSPTGVSGSRSSTGFFEPVFYLLSIGIGVGALVGRIPLGRRAERRVRRVRGAGDAGHLGDERRGLRRDVQHVLQAALRAHVRVDAGDPDRRRATSRRASWPGPWPAEASTRSGSWSSLSRSGWSSAGGPCWRCRSRC